jgi:hypothetical protein
MGITLKDKILVCLQRDEESRNSDIRLTQTLWWTYHNSSIIKQEVDGEAVYFVKLRDLFTLPREDAIKRVRAIIQNVDHKFLPTKEEVRKQRKINEERWLTYVRNKGRLPL